jgi:hypothetical protein
VQLSNIKSKLTKPAKAQSLRRPHLDNVPAALFAALAVADRHHNAAIARILAALTTPAVVACGTINTNKFSTIIVLRFTSMQKSNSQQQH